MRRPDLEAEVKFLTTEEGGREHFVRSGYRPKFCYRSENYDAVQEFVGKDKVYPGQTAVVRFQFLHPESLVNRIDVGDDFKILESNRTVATGRVTRILRLAENAVEIQQKMDRKRR